MRCRGSGASLAHSEPVGTPALTWQGLRPTGHECPVCGRVLSTGGISVIPRHNAPLDEPVLNPDSDRNDDSA